MKEVKVLQVEEGKAGAADWRRVGACLPGAPAHSLPDLFVPQQFVTLLRVGPFQVVTEKVKEC